MRVNTGHINSTKGSTSKKKKKFKGYLPVTQGILFIIFSIQVETVHCLNYTGQDCKKKYKKNYRSLCFGHTPMTLKQGQGHHTRYDFVGPSKVIIMQKSKDLLLKCLEKRPKLKDFVFQMRKCVDYFSPLTTCEFFFLNQTRRANAQTFHIQLQN